MDFQVRKGLETPLKVHGMRTKFFCIYCIILAVIVLFVVGFLTSAMSGEGSFLAFIVSLVAGAFASVVLRIVFINLSMQRKFGKDKHNHTETDLHLGLFEKRVQNDLSVRVLFDVDYDAETVAVGLVLNAIGGSGTEAWIDRKTLEFEFTDILYNWTQNDFIQDWVRGRAVLNTKKSSDKLQHLYFV